MAESRPLNPPGYGLAGTNPETFRQSFEQYVRDATEQESQLADVQARNESLTQALADASSRADAAEANHAALGEQLATVQAAHGVAVAAYRQARLDGDPSIPPGIVEGGTVEDVDQSLARARAASDHVKAALAAQTPSAPAGPPAAPLTPPRIAAGAPGRLPVDTTKMSASEKLAYGTQLAREGRS